MTNFLIGLLIAAPLSFLGGWLVTRLLIRIDHLAVGKRKQDQVARHHYH